eukprot:Gregarina_sp_Pseudo_9__2419@NODE_2713_length_903_cov_21_848380_g2485_i0_p1_GENE_NODE_2713_length_903_cov_21_848380_g2485_i0NODE_2713_length_903_cov_21_848380_g2485_i0_p1_ORF_typecomplete_len127_score14_18TMEM131_like/PF12371_8/0_16_NODE_2713_length_903_cov_21_848380_g2485_i0125505
MSSETADCHTATSAMPRQNWRDQRCALARGGSQKPPPLLRPQRGITPQTITNNLALAPGHRCAFNVHFLPTSVDNFLACFGWICCIFSVAPRTMMWRSRIRLCMYRASHRSMEFTLSYVQHCNGSK